MHMLITATEALIISQIGYGLESHRQENDTHITNNTNQTPKHTNTNNHEARIKQLQVIPQLNKESPV